VPADRDFFPATLGVHERWMTTAAVTFGTVGMSALGIVFTIRSGHGAWLFLALPFAIMLFLAARYAPSGYRLAGDGIRVERRAGPAFIPYATIRTVDRRPRAVAGLSLAASKGVFGRFGRFWNPSLGFYRLYLTNRDDIVWLGTTRGWVGLSPDRPGEFVERVEGRLPSSRNGA
jgi:hypothetical protein